MPERRRLILDRAGGVIYRQGFGATTVADILGAAGVGKGNFYHYFEGKQDFGLAIIDTLRQELAGADLDEVFSPMKPPARRLSDYLELVSKARRLDESGDPLCTLASELGATPPYAERIRGAFASLIDRFEALVAEFAIEMGTKVDAQRLARLLVAQIHGLCLQFKVDRNVATFEGGLAYLPTVLANAVGSAVQGDEREAVEARAKATG